MRRRIHRTEHGEKKATRKDYFDSLGQFLTYIDTAKNMTPEGSQQSTEGSDRFRMGPYSEVRKFAEDGWPEGMKTASLLTMKMVSTIASTLERYDPYYSVESSGQLDVARYTEGEPECWIHLDTITSAGPGIKHLTLVFNGSASAGISHEVMIQKGAAVAALVEVLEYAGHRVKAILAYGASSRDAGSGSDLDTYITLKDFGDPLDLDRLTFAMAHPGMLRGLIFKYMECLPDAALHERLRVGYSYGMPSEVEDKGDLYIPKSGLWEQVWTDPESTLAWIRERLTEQGVHFREGEENG